MGRGELRRRSRPLKPTWRPVHDPTFDLDTETDRIVAEVLAMTPRPARIVVSLGDHRVTVGVPRGEDPEMFKAMLRDGLHDLAERVV